MAYVFLDKPLSIQALGTHPDLTRGEVVHLWKDISENDPIHLTGSILSIDRTYIAYDANLVPYILSGAIEVDIEAKRGESGTPIWSEAGELIGLINATDTHTKRSFLV
jgi:S1-C subfamily serine protease